MPRRVGPVKVRQYSLEFKLKAVKLSQLPGVEVQAVADALEIHPFDVLDVMKRVNKRAHTLLQEEHALLKKLIRFTSARKPTSSRSSTKRGDGSV